MEKEQLRMQVRGKALPWRLVQQLKLVLKSITRYYFTQMNVNSDKRRTHCHEMGILAFGEA